MDETPMDRIAVDDGIPLGSDVEEAETLLRRASLRGEIPAALLDSLRSDPDG